MTRKTDPPPLVSTCALDVADDGPHTLEQVAKVMGSSREWIRQIEQRAIAKAIRIADRLGIVLASVK